MESVETIECRIYMAENDMFLAARTLAAELHDLESAIDGLRNRVHQTLCENGRQPVAAQARTILAEVSATVGSFDLTGIRRKTRDLEGLLARLEGLEEDRKAACERPVASVA